MSMLLKVVWGCLVTALSLSPVGEVFLGLFGNIFVVSVVVIAVVGFGPVLFPMGNLKLFFFIWGFLGSFLLLERRDVDKLNYLLLAWGPLISIAAVTEWLRIRRDGGYSKGKSVLRDNSGRMADWTFTADGLEIAIDFNARELRVRARRAQWFDATFTTHEGPVALVRPLLECSFQFDAVKKTEYRGTVAYSYGTTASGESVRMSVPQEGYKDEYATGEIRMEIAHGPAEWKVVDKSVSRWSDDSLKFRGRVERRSGKRNITVKLGPIPKDISAKLQAQWKSSVEPKIAELESDLKSRLLADAEAVAVDEFLRAEQARAGA